MSSFHCPYCELKALAKAKTMCKAIRPRDGRCPDCGAYIDAGQHHVEINGYADIYKGAIGLIDDVVEQFNELLRFCNIDLSDYAEDGKIKLNLYTSEIIERLFTPYVGGTTKSNVAKSLEIEEHSHTWLISKDDVQDED